jgi:hypothetical protein
MHKEECDHWGQFFLMTVYPAIVREQAYIGLLILEKMKGPLLLKSKQGKKQEYQKTRETIIELQAESKELAGEIKSFFDTDLWDRLGIERPDYGDIDGVNEWLNDLVEDFFRLYPEEI